MDLLLEAIESITLACTLAVLVPGSAITLVGARNAPVAAAGYVAGIGVVSFVRFGGWIPAPDAALSHVVIAVVLATAAAVTLVRPQRPFAALGGFVFGAAVSLYWRPCVGLEFGAILNDIPDAPVTTFPQHIVFVTVLLLPIIVLAALPEALPRLAAVRSHRGTVSVGAGLCVVLVGVVAVGRFDDLMGELFRISSG